jgi:hypothetical protein
MKLVVHLYPMDVWTKRRLTPDSDFPCREVFYLRFSLDSLWWARRTSQRTEKRRKLALG